MKALPDRMFSTDSPKAIKAGEYGYLNAIMYLAPYTLGGKGNLCPDASPGCMALCLGWYSGQAGMAKGEALNSVRDSRALKAQHFMRNRQAFMRNVALDIARNVRRARAKGLKLCVRLNGSSDIAYEGIRVALDPATSRAIEKISGIETKPGNYANIFAVFPSIQFVDYTKNPRRFAKKLPSNYRLTFSRSETNEADCRNVLSLGGTVAVVFAESLPATYLGARVIDGDKHDLRHLDPRGVVVGLLPKGHKARRDASGFIVRHAA
jgi:hypothetical protein